jgi:hypothetical protein
MKLITYLKIGNVTDPDLVYTCQLFLLDQIGESDDSRTIRCATPVLLRCNGQPIFSVPGVKSVSPHLGWPDFQEKMSRPHLWMILSDLGYDLFQIGSFYSLAL